MPWIGMGGSAWAGPKAPFALGSGLQHPWVHTEPALLSPCKWQQGPCQSPTRARLGVCWKPSLQHQHLLSRLHRLHPALICTTPSSWEKRPQITTGINVPAVGRCRRIHPGWPPQWRRVWREPSPASRREHRGTAAPWFVHQRGPSGAALSTLGCREPGRGSGDAGHSLTTSLPPAPAVSCVFGVGF